MFKFKKVASLLASTFMIGSTIGLAAASVFPAPFVESGSGNVAIVYGSNAATQITDLVAATNIADTLNSHVVDDSVTPTEPNVDGEAYELFTSSTPMLLNSTLSSIRQTVSSGHLPSVLADGEFDGTTSVDYTQRIEVGNNPLLAFKQQPTGDDDPALGFALGTTTASQYVYNATVTFDSNVNFTDSDSTGETLELFGETFTVGGATTSTKLILLRSSETIDLRSDGEMSREVEVDGETYTVEMVFAEDTKATIKITDSNGDTEQKEINEDSSKTIMGLEVSLTFANENEAGVSQATVTVGTGSSKITLQDGSSVQTGGDNDAVDGTLVNFYLTNGTRTSTLNRDGVGKIEFQVSASNSDEDAILAGSSFVDPVFGTFKVDFPSVTEPLDGTGREMIEVKPSGSDKMNVKFMSHDGDEAKTVNYIYNKTDSYGPGMQLADSSGRPIIVREMEAVNKSQYLVLSNTNEGGLYKVESIYNATTGYSDDYVTLQNVFTGDSTQHKATSEGTVTGLTEQGKTFTLTYVGAQTLSEEARTIRVNSDESSGNNVILFPTVTTDNGAKIAFYEQTSINLSNWDGGSNNATGLMFDDGDGYTTATITVWGNATHNTFSLTAGSTTTYFNSTASATVPIGRLNYNVSSTGNTTTATINLMDPQGGNIVRPALIVFEEKDDASNYEAMIVTHDGGYDGSDSGVGVGEVVRTWGSDTVNDEVQMRATDEDKYQELDLWGSLITLDKGDSDQVSTTISYPDDQLQANIYIAEIDAAISGGSSGGNGQTVGVPILDSEVSSVSAKNWIVVGGSCVNSVAADLLDLSYPTCSADWTTATNVGAGQYLIQTFDRTGGKVATLVAGFNAGDTTNAATYLRTQSSVDTTAGKKYIGTTGNTASLVTEETA